MLFQSKARIVSLNPHQWMIAGFGLIILLGAGLLALPASSQTGVSIGFLDALFTSTSAVCVTGLVVLDTGTDFSLLGQIIIMSLIQIGGLGFMTFGVMIAIALGKKLGLKYRLLLQESTKAATIQGLFRLALSILAISFALEAIGAVILTLRWMGELGLGKAVYYGIFHSISSFNNAGFALWSDSLSGFRGDPVVNLVITALFIIGGIGFTVMIDVAQKRRWSRFALHTKIVLLSSLILTVLGFIVIFAMELLNPTFREMSLTEQLWTAYFQGVTTRTAGFNTVDIGGMMAPSLFFMIILMFIGASSGSTGGGIKTNTFFVLVFATYATIKGRNDVQVMGRKITQDIVLRALAVIMASLGVVIFVAFVLTITEHALEKDFLATLFESASAFGTVGLSMGLTPELTPAGKLIIILTMFVGRLGPLTLAFALAQKKRSPAIGYPEEKVLIG